MKRLFTLLALAGGLLLATSCHKNCVCQGYNGGVRTYSAEEVEARGGECDAMRHFPVEEYYVVCNWE